MKKVYILQLENERYYIGLTVNLSSLKKDYLMHANGEASPWTKIYPPLYIKRVIDDCTEFDEDKWTKIYMLRYGIDKVRGGTYNYLYICSNVERFLESEFSSLEQRISSNRETLELSPNRRNVLEFE